ncbi:class I SAM-dependent DNA methyltransferase [Vibrio viridaestus]|uniref:Class I SAM-dependent methyltransferase n=1 Tax=Vibrio viridaestus TaxID=2487322 RepID=A0A3N9U448_9VIBR|nr:class I SAM-dependent methyltransferase [Vibrio viridaestus]RQW64362.1 class I SAM-dependent methyltransferase [Vibrio viridaestus]
MKNYFDTVAHEWDNSPSKVERAEKTVEQIKQVHFPSTASCVDFGSGTGLLGVQLRGLFDTVHLVDESSEMLNVAQQKLSAANIDSIQTHCISSLSQLTGTHSAIVTLMALHHIVDTATFFREANSALEPEGILIVADLYQEDGSFHHHNPNFNGHNGFTEQLLREHALDTGFTVEKMASYYEIEKQNSYGELVRYPLFFFVARKAS